RTFNLRRYSQARHTRPSMESSCTCWHTLVFFKGLLGEAVECQCGNGAFETRSGHAPRAVRAAPAGEVVAFDPDQSFIHTSTSFMVALGLELGRRGWNNQ